MPALDHLLAPALLQALGWTLLHSLWQGTGLGLGVALLLWALRQQAAVVRYRVAAVALATLVGLASATFAHYYQQVPSPAASASAAGYFISQPVYAAMVVRQHAAVAPLLPEWRGLLHRAPAYLERHLAVGVAIWLLGFVLMLGRLLLALRYVRRLRQRVSPVPAAWQRVLAGLVARAGLTQGVELRASVLVPSPLVIGYLKPIILLPLSVAGGLRPAELEMILAHELAHIVRRDYLFNFVQALAETVFFYHPAVWYLTAVLDAEREHCCDDLASHIGGHPHQLAHALAALAELTAAAVPLPRLTLAAVGRRGSLLSRVQRLAHGRPTRTTGLWPATTALLVLGLGLGTMVYHAQAARLARHTNLIRSQRAATRKTTPDDAPLTARPALATSDGELQLLLQQQLQADGLLLTPDYYTIDLTSRQLRVNGQPQPAGYLARYQRLYEAATGHSMTPATTYHTRNEVTYQAAFTTTKPDPEHAALLQQLRRDGLLPANARQLQVTITKDGMLLLNGQPQPPARLAMYRPLLLLPPNSAGSTTTLTISLP
jgi:beta-lactamase regulating signal transducer with metallopeptidase domain